MTKATWGERVYCAYTSVSEFIFEGRQSRNPGRENTLRVLAEAIKECLLILLLQHPGPSRTTMGWALPHQSLNKKMPYRFAHSLMEAFSRRFPPPR